MKQRFIHPLCITIVWLVWSGICTGQPGTPVHILDIDDGLSQGYVTSIVQGKRGFLWFGTSDGLNKYDGYTFKVYRHDPNDPASIAHNKIGGLTWTKDDRLWIDFYARGLGMYDPSRDQFLHIPLSQINARGPVGSKVHLIARVADDLYLVVNQSGPVLLRIKQVAVFEKKPSPAAGVVHPAFTYELLPLNAPAGMTMIDWSQNVQMLQSQANRIWINSVKPAGLFQLHLDAENRQYEIRWFVSAAGSTPFVYPGNVSTLLVEDTARHLLYFNVGENIFQWQEYSERLTGPYVTLKSSSIGQATIDSYGNLWWTRSNVLYTFDPDAGCVQEHSFSDEYIRRKLSGSETMTFIDRSGIIWMGTSGHGLVKYRIRDKAFHHRSIPGLGNGSVYKIDRTLRGSVRLMTWDNSTYGLHTATRSLILMPRPLVTLSNFHDDGQEIPVPANKDRKRILDKGDFYLDVDVNTQGRVYRFLNPVHRAHLILTDYMEGYREIIAREDSLAGPLHVDTNRNIWQVFMNGTIRKLNLYSGEQEEFNLPIRMVHGTPLRMSVFQPYDDRRFILATNYGVLLFDAWTHQGTLFQIGTQSEETNSIYHILSICQDTAGGNERIWLGFEGAGLGRQDLTTGELKLYTTADGLPNQIINSIQMDDDGHLWISTNLGLSKMDTTSEKFTNFSSVDGLQSNEFNRHTGARLSTGEMIFGGVNGINCFDPEDIIESTYNPSLEFTQIQVGQNIVPQYYYVNGPNPDRNLVYTVPYNSNFITFQFASLDFSAPLKNMYRFRLEGLEDHWSDPTTERSVSYRYLPSGEYTFHVQGTNSDGRWSDKTATFIVQIRRPWWLQFWFTAIMSILIVLGIYFIIQFRVRHEMRIQELRNRISADLHDEIGSSLSSISLYSQALLMQNKDPGQKSIIEKIKVNSQLVQEGLNDIVWSIKPGSDATEDIYHRMYRIGQELMEIKNIEFSFEVEPSLRNQSMGFTLKRSLYFIYKEALHNILKYAEAQNVKVRIYPDGKQLVMEIRDDGVGFDTGSPMRGNGLYNMEKRAREMRGTLDLHSVEGVGTVLKVVL